MTKRKQAEMSCSVMTLSWPVTMAQSLASVMLRHMKIQL